MQHVLNGSSNHFLKRGMLSKGVVALKKRMKIGLPLTK